MRTIAVYGSLKSGKYNHDLLRGSKYVGLANEKGNMYLVSSYPAFEPSEEGSDYAFELYEVSDNVFEAVDNMELGAGYDSVEKDFTVSGKVIKAIFYPAGKSLLEYCKQNRPIIHCY